LRGRIVPNRLPLRRSIRDPRVYDWHHTGQPCARISLGTVLVNWAGLVALWALPYLTLLDHFRPDAARSEILEWSLLIVGALGLVSVLYTAWKETLDPTFRARHGLSLRKRADRPHTGNVA
jgi:hypothetical protein